MTTGEIKEKIGAGSPVIIEVRKNSAVLLPLVRTEEGLCVLFEKRTGTISHAGETCFPGGAVDKGETPLEAVKRGEEPADIFRANADRMKQSIVITTDISGGIVPMDPVLRAWREACGRMNTDLAARADEVWRLFCGIPQRLK